MSDEHPWRGLPEYEQVVLRVPDTNRLAVIAHVDALCAAVWKAATEREAWGNTQDLQVVAQHCSEAYDAMTRGRISKPNTLPTEAISIMEELAQQDIDEAVAAERARADRLAALLRRLRSWDQMVMGKGDEPYWCREIDAALAAEPGYAERALVTLRGPALHGASQAASSPEGE